jgi:hypothetical protein
VLQFEANTELTTVLDEVISWIAEQIRLGRV